MNASTKKDLDSAGKQTKKRNIDNTERTIRRQLNNKKALRAGRRFSAETKEYDSFMTAFRKARDKEWTKKNQRRKEGRQSFHLVHSEDQKRKAAPSCLSHAVMTLKLVFANWRLFLPLIAIIVIFNILMVGLMSEDAYYNIQEKLVEEHNALQDNSSISQLALSSLMVLSTVTSGGLVNSSSADNMLVESIVLLVLWLVVIYLLRRILAGKNVKLRDAFYNAPATAISTCLVFVVFAIHCVPFIIFLLTYSAAVQTGFLTTPLYSFLFWVFAILLIAFSLYLVAGSIMALVAVSMPGVYPMMAVNAAGDLVRFRRFAVIKHILFMLLFVAVMWIVVTLPVIYLDFMMKASFELVTIVPIVPLCLQIMTIFSLIYATSYIYLLYRRLLDERN